MSYSCNPALLDRCPVWWCSKTTAWQVNKPTITIDLVQTAHTYMVQPHVSEAFPRFVACLAVI